MNANYGPVYDLALWLEPQLAATPTIRIGLGAPDPTAAEPTTMAFVPYGSDARPSPGAKVQRFQSVARGPSGHAWLAEAYDLLAGLETTLDGSPVTVVPLQSAPQMVGTEDTGGEVWTLNYSLEWE